MSYKNTKNTISVGKTSRCHIKYDIYGKNHRCHIKTRFMWAKTIDVLKDIYGKNY